MLRIRTLVHAEGSTDLFNELTEYLHTNTELLNNSNYVRNHRLHAVLYGVEQYLKRFERGCVICGSLQYVKTHRFYGHICTRCRGEAKGRDGRLWRRAQIEVYEKWRDLEDERRSRIEKAKARKKTRKGLSARARFLVLQRDNFCCHYCGRHSSPDVGLHVDHVIPVARGGKNTHDNLVASCADCNLGKGKHALAVA